MSDMKCPICGNDLERYHTGLVCYRHCLNGKNVWGSEETLKKLDRTRKALDVAVDALNTIKGKHDPHCAVYHIDEKTAYDALEQITALEKSELENLEMLVNNVFK